MTSHGPMSMQAAAAHARTRQPSGPSAPLCKSEGVALPQKGEDQALSRSGLGVAHGPGGGGGWCLWEGTGGLNVFEHLLMRFVAPWKKRVKGPL